MIDRLLEILMMIALAITLIVLGLVTVLLGMVVIEAWRQGLR